MGSFLLRLFLFFESVSTSFSSTTSLGGDNAFWKVSYLSTRLLTLGRDNAFWKVSYLSTRLLTLLLWLPLLLGKFGGLVIFLVEVIFVGVIFFRFSES